MKKQFFLIILIISTLIINNYPQSASAQTSYTIPQWVRNNALWWGEGNITDSEFAQSIQYLIDNNIIQVSSSEKEKMVNSVASQGAILQILAQKLNIARPATLINNDELNWFFTDSKGTSYHWHIPMTAYDNIVNQRIPIGVMQLKMPDGQTVNTYDYKQFITQIMSRPDFTQVIDQVYTSSGNDTQFIYEVWYIVSELTTYNFDTTNSNLMPLEVFTRGEGDCKDKSILIADMLRSSSHTKDWKISLEIMDKAHPSNPQKINHMVVVVNTGKYQYVIESTAEPPDNGVNYWAGKPIYGWSIPTEPPPLVIDTNN